LLDLAYCHILGAFKLSPLKKVATLLLLVFSVFNIHSQTSSDLRLGWKNYTDSISGFTIQLPEKPTIKKQEMSSPELEGAKVPQKIAFAADIDAGINYMILTSDMPLGYFIEDKNESFRSVFERIVQQGSDFSEVTTIFKDGIEGRYFTGLLQGKYFVRSWYFIRGNRAYYFLVQNSNTAPLTDDYFIESLSFIPLKPAVLVPDTVDNYALTHFGKFNITNDEAYLFISKTTNILAQNPFSGGSYLTELAELEPYFNVLSLDTFYANFVDGLVGWSDSLISDVPVEMNGKPGREVLIYSLTNQSTSRGRFWIDNNNLISIHAYCADEENGSEVQETFFNSFTRLPNAPTFDIFASKAVMLLEDVGSTDTTIQIAAFRALDYYEFDSTEVPLLHAAVQKSWPDDRDENGIRGQLIDHIEYFEMASSIPVLTSIYLDKALPTKLRNHALLAIPALGDSGIVAYTELFLTTPPDSAQYYYQYFSPFYDSLPFAATQFERMLPLINDKTLGAGVLAVADRLMTKDSATYYPMVYAAMPTLTANAITEATMERDSANAETYYFSATLSQLIEVLGHFAGYPVIDPFTTILMDESIDEYTVSDAIKLRLKSKLKVPKEALERCFKDIYSRYPTLESCYQTGNEKLIPKEYKSAEGVAHAMFTEYFGYDDEYPDKVKTVGTLDINGQTYYALQAEYTWDGSFNYFGVCGPIDKKYPLAALKDAKCNSEWDDTQSDWKTQAQLLIETLAEDGWPWEE
jgi:hypothetical protein